MRRDFRRAFPKNEKDENNNQDLVDFITVKEVSKLLRCSEGHIYNLVRKNKIPSYSPSGKLLFDQKEVIKWVKGEQI
jgi:excisionase family DNA binding protein